MKPPRFWASYSLWSLLLLPLSGLYILAGIIRYYFKKPYKTSRPVICVGNAVMGGAGKTPVVLALIDILKENGHIPHVLSRGYGGRLKGPVLVDIQRHSAFDVGDEPLLLAQKTPTWVGKNRILSAKAAVKQGATILIMDDGFQNPSLFKDISLLVLSASSHGNGLVFPAGPLREPLQWALKRAQAVICSKGECPVNIVDVLRYNSFVFQSHLISFSSVPSKPCIAFAGIGYPEKFRLTLQKEGVKVIAFYSYADHYNYTEKDLLFLSHKAEEAQAILITTTKDHVRLPPHWQDQIYAWEVTIQFENDFKKWLVSRL